MPRSTPDDELDRETDEDRAEAIDAIERSLVALRRSMSRRTLGRQMMAAAGNAYDLRVLETLDAIVTSLAESGSCTVGDVAENLARDRSQASRAVTRAVELGLVERVADQDDARRVELRLTDEGLGLEAEMQEVRRAHARARTAAWDRDELVRFGRALARFTGAERDPD